MTKKKNSSETVKAAPGVVGLKEDEVGNALAVMAAHLIAIELRLQALEKGASE